MVYVPLAGITPLDPDPTWPVTAQLHHQRRLTHWFISNDPSEIVLIPQEKTETPSGGFRFGPLPPRPPQKFKKIYPAGSSDGRVETEDGQQRKFDFILVGDWNATIKVNDFWEESEDTFWIVKGHVPFNGYEVKVLVQAFGGPVG